MSWIVYGTQRVEITLRNSDGSDGSVIRLQCVTREGLKLAFAPLGSVMPLGSGAGWRKAWTGRKFRPTLETSWDFALTSTIDGLEVDTAEALRRIHNAAWVYPVAVKPHADDPWTFDAQPDPDTPFSLSDLKGVAHCDLTLRLVGRIAVDLPFSPINTRSGAGFGAAFGFFGG